MNHPATDPAFILPIQTLSKLKPARDLAYLRRSIPDMAKYRLAHLLLKAWAKSRGLYAAKFGLLGGINIATMLVPVCKLLAYNGTKATTTDILATFFHHYADFDWGESMVFDPLFHGNIKYHRTHRESMCLLGWHTPSLNTALNASVSTVQTLSVELKRARDLLMQESITWNTFLCGTKQSMPLPELTARNAAEFLTSYKSYIKIDARYWGSSVSKGRRFVGWLESRCVRVLVGELFCLV
jgi:poly(A) polymerase Pap1